MSDLFHPEIPFDYIAKVFAVMAITPWHTYQVLTKQSKRMVEYFEQYENGLPDSRELEDLIIPYWDLMHTTPKSKEYGLRAELKEAGWFYDTHYSEFGNDSNLTMENHGPLKNVWLGVSVENDDYLPRVADLVKTPAAIRFISYEPALGPISFRWASWHDYSFREVKIHNEYDGFRAINWVICGGESGTGKDVLPMHPDWARSLRDQCKAAGVAFFFKQWGKYLPKCQSEGVDTTGYKIVKFQSPNNPDKQNEYFNMGKHAAGSLLDGKEWKEMPNGCI